MNNINEIVTKQREYYNTYETRNINFRIAQLTKLKTIIQKYEQDILLALKQDLNKSQFESYATELGMVYEELKYMQRNIRSLAKVKRARTPLMHFPSKSYVYSDPYGVVLVMSPWNYPFNLSIVPVIGAIACGNTVVIKPSNYATSTADIVERIFAEFDDKYIAVVKGGREVNQELLDQKFDYIFFTGSPTVGHVVMEKASKHLTPITLELGGKSPCIVDSTANIDLSAKRIVWGKMLNAGQTCVAPDYILVDSAVKQQLISAIHKYSELFYGSQAHYNTEYPKIINLHHYQRLQSLINASGIDASQQCNDSTMQIGLTLVDNATLDSPVMQEEIFGPILPIIQYDNIEDVINIINNRPLPLALYLFTTSNSNEKNILSKAQFGGGCVNDTIIHLANPNVPFGGVGDSGMGSYHGKNSFDTFSHKKSVTKKSNLIDINIRYAPYKDKIRALKKFL